MQLNDTTIDTPPRDAASVVLLREGASGPEVLLLRRHASSQVLGGAYVFPGGKLERSDSAPATQARLDAPAATLHAALGESALNPDVAAGLFVAALREAFEESGVLLATQAGRPPDAGARQRAVAAIRAGTPFDALLVQHDWQLDSRALAPWSRWITPRRPAMMNRRFDTRFFLAAVPDEQEAQHDDHEVTEARWLKPRTALAQYRDRQIDLAPPQIVSLLHLLPFGSVAAALADARTRPPPLVEPHTLQHGAERMMCYPGDPEYPVAAPALTRPTRLVWRDERFQPPEGFGPWID
ncbi:NUDIX hydrolase [Ottowia sp.]|uniref:NUDIX hydrolase n=1 Tax=Ottowia sp. TaxID=1898956 RepID=UPI002BE93B14|nr:NUDIX hydrolase [Ottowia sp.]